MRSPPEPVLAFLRERHADAAALALAIRERVLAAEPDLTERVYRGWNGIGFRHPSGGFVCAIYPQPDATVRLLFEHGTRIDDPDDVLGGDGRQTRHLTIRSAEDADRLDIAGYVARAVAERLFRER